MTETKSDTMLDSGGKSVVALMAALMAAIFAFQLNASMLSPALATMRVELNTTDAQIGLTQTVFFTSCAVFSLFLPRLGDLIGRKKVLLGILVLTAIGCVVSALAVNVPMLMAGRVIQGVAGPIVPMTPFSAAGLLAPSDSAPCSGLWSVLRCWPLCSCSSMPRNPPRPRPRRWIGLA